MKKNEPNSRRKAIKGVVAATAVGLGAATVKAATPKESKPEKIAGNITMQDDVPLFSGHTILGNLVFIAGKGAHFDGDIAAHTDHVLNEIEKELNSGKQHPRDVKMSLAREILAIYHSEASVEPAEEAFKRVFQEGDLPEEMPELKVEQGETLVDFMVRSELAKSKSAARRLIEQRGVRLDDEVIEDAAMILEINSPQVLRVGKRRFVRLLAS